MGDVIDALILDLLESIAPQPKPYAELQRTWRTSCPRLPVWEEACDRGFIERRRGTPDTVLACLTPRGRTFLDEHRPEALAAVSAQELTLEAQWDASFRKHPDPLKQLAKEALDEHRAGRTELLDPDKR